MASFIIRKPRSTNPHPNTRQGPIKASIVEDDPHDCLAINRVLEQTGEFVCAGVHHTAKDALDQIPCANPSVVLMDIGLPGMSGLQCAPLLKAMLPGLIVVFVSGLADKTTVFEAMDSGGAGYLTKPVQVAQFMVTVHVAFQRARLATRDHSLEGLRALNHRENAVLECIAAGLANKQIAERLKMSLYVVTYVVRRICQKFGAANRAEAASHW